MAIIEYLVFLFMAQLKERHDILKKLKKIVVLLFVSLIQVAPIMRFWVLSVVFYFGIPEG